MGHKNPTDRSGRDAEKSLKRFNARGVETVFRYPRPSDLDTFIAMHDILTEEKVMCRRLTLDRASGEKMLSTAIDQLKRAVGTYILVEQNGELVGEGFAGRSGHEYYTVGLALIGRVRGMGIGTELMWSLEEECRHLGARRLYLTVFAANEAGIHVYENVGYRECGRRPDWILLDDGSTCDLLDMTKILEAR